MKKYFLVKSFEEDFILKTIINKNKISSQKISNIIKTKKIKPNTNSFGKKKRLSCTIINENYVKTYRSQGLIFQTKEVPKSIYPFDLAVLTKNNNLIVNYYKIEKNLHEYYSFNLIKGYEKFLFKDFKTMLNKINSTESTLKMVNDFREKAGFKKLTLQKMKLLRYNEIIFEKEIEINPIAIFGYKKNSKEISKKFNLKHYTSVKKFVEDNNI